MRVIQCSRSRPGGRRRSRSRKTSAPDWPEPTTVTCPAARAVRGGRGSRRSGRRGPGPLGERAQGLGHVRGGADADDQVAGVGASDRLGLAVGAQAGVVDVEQGLFGVPAHGVDAVPEVQGGELAADPAAVVVVLGARDVEALGEVEGVQPLVVPQVVEEAPRVGGVGEGHQVGEEGHLQGGALDEQPGVPVEGGALLVPGGLQSGLGVGEGGEGEVGGADADADQVVGLWVGHRRGSRSWRW